MKKVVITGNIAGGKSGVENYLINLGYKVIDADKVNHYILENDVSVINEVKNLFYKDDICTTDGKISREKLGQIVFSDRNKLKSLEKILHKRINQIIGEFINSNSEENLVFVSMALLFETKQENNYDYIIFVSAPKDIRLERLMRRNGYSYEYANKRIEAQMDEKEKIKKSDFVILNNSDFANLEKQVNEVLSKLV